MTEVTNSTQAHPELLDSQALEAGYRSNHVAVKQFFRGFEWMVGNLPREQRWKLDSLMCHGIRVAELLKPDDDSDHSNDRSDDQANLRIQAACNELNRAFASKSSGQPVSPEWLALADTCRSPGCCPDQMQRLLLEGLQAADAWSRRREFQTFEELVEFTSQVGGALMTAAVSVLGWVKPGYQQAARDCGTGVLLLQLLANFSAHASQQNVFLAQQDLDDCKIVLQRIKLRQPGQEVKHLVRLYCHRIEKILTGGGQLVGHLDYDAKRSVTSLLATHWRMLMKMKLEPESIFSEEGVLSKGDWFRLRARHLLGLGGNVPIIANETHH